MCTYTHTESNLKKKSRETCWYHLPSCSFIYEFIHPCLHSTNISWAPALSQIKILSTSHILLYVSLPQGLKGLKNRNSTYKRKGVLINLSGGYYFYQQIEGEKNTGTNNYLLPLSSLHPSFSLYHFLSSLSSQGYWVQRLLNWENLHIKHRALQPYALETNYFSLCFIKSFLICVRIVVGGVSVSGLFLFYSCSLERSTQFCCNCPLKWLKYTVIIPYAHITLAR